MNKPLKSVLLQRPECVSVAEPSLAVSHWDRVLFLLIFVSGRLQEAINSPEMKQTNKQTNKESFPPNRNEKATNDDGLIDLRSERLKRRRSSAPAGRKGDRKKETLRKKLPKNITLFVYCQNRWGIFWVQARKTMISFLLFYFCGKEPQPADASCPLGSK